MNDRPLKKMLAESFKREEELYDFCIECLERIYEERAKNAINKFNDSLDFYEFNGCISSLRMIENSMKQDKDLMEGSKKMKEENKNE